jgi:hypothetical protein
LQNFGICSSCLLFFTDWTPLHHSSHHGRLEVCNLPRFSSRSKLTQMRQEESAMLAPANVS